MEERCRALAEAGQTLLDRLSEGSCSTETLCWVLRASSSADVLSSTAAQWDHELTEALTDVLSLQEAAKGTASSADPPPPAGGASQRAAPPPKAAPPPPPGDRALCRCGRTLSAGGEAQGRWCCRHCPEGCHSRTCKDREAQRCALAQSRTAP